MICNVDDGSAQPVCFVAISKKKLPSENLSGLPDLCHQGEMLMW